MKDTLLHKIEEMVNESMQNISESIHANNLVYKASEEEKLKILKLIKADLVKANDSKEYNLDSEGEAKVLIAMVEQRNKSIKEYQNGGREDLATIEKNEIALIMEIEPKVKEYFDSLPSEEDIENYTKQCLDEYVAEKGNEHTLSMADIGSLVKLVKAKYKDANGNIIKKVLQEAIGKQ